jgi:hypothetical protein
MVYKFEGALAELHQLIETTDLDGKWTDNLPGKHRFRSNDGGVLTWWSSSGSILIQGQHEAKIKLEGVFAGKSSVLIH